MSHPSLAGYGGREHTPLLPTDAEHVADQCADLDELTVEPGAPLISGDDGTSVQPIGWGIEPTKTRLE